MLHKTSNIVEICLQFNSRALFNLYGLVGADQIDPNWIEYN